MENAIEIIAKLDNDAIVLDADDRAGALEKWQTAKRFAEDQFCRTPTPDWSYLLGYLCYMIYSRGAGSFALTEKYLIGALVPGPKQGLAQYYLASLYFDVGKFTSAMQQLERIYKSGKEYFRGLGQPWRYVKAVEMLVAAHVVTGSWFNAQVLGSQLEVIYRECEEPDSMIPLALVGALEKIDSGGLAYEEICRIAVSLVLLTNSRRAIIELFPAFSRKWLLVQE